MIDTSAKQERGKSPEISLETAKTTELGPMLAALVMKDLEKLNKDRKS